MRTAVFVRPVEGYAAKLVLDQAIIERRRELDEWSFARGIYLSHSVFGSLRSGFSEFVSLTTRRQDPAVVVGALEQANHTARMVLLTDGHARKPHPRGFNKLLLADQDFGVYHPPSGAYEPLRTWKQVAGSAVPETPELTTTEVVDDGQLSILGRIWPLQAADLRGYLAVRLLEHILGSSEPGAALRPLRDSGDTYAAVGRYVYDLGVLVVGVLAAFTEPLEERTQKLLDSVRPTTEQLEAARRDFWFQFQLGESASSLHALAPFALLDPAVTVARLGRLVSEIRLDEVTGILASAGDPMRKAVDEHGLV